MQKSKRVEMQKFRNVDIQKCRKEGKNKKKSRKEEMLECINVYKKGRNVQKKKYRKIVTQKILNITVSIANIEMFRNIEKQKSRNVKMYLFLFLY